MQQKGLLEVHGQKEKCNPAPQGPGALVTQDMEKAEVLNIPAFF